MNGILDRRSSPNGVRNLTAAEQERWRDNINFKAARKFEKDMASYIRALDLRTAYLEQLCNLAEGLTLREFAQLEPVALEEQIKSIREIRSRLAEFILTAEKAAGRSFDPHNSKGKRRSGKKHAVAA